MWIALLNDGITRPRIVDVSGEGRFAATVPLGACRVKVTVVAPLHVSARTEFDVPAEWDLDVGTIRLRSFRALGGTVRFMDGADATDLTAHARLQFEDFGSERWKFRGQTSQVGADGSFSIPSLRPEPHEVWFEYESPSGSVEMPHRVQDVVPGRDHVNFVCRGLVQLEATVTSAQTCTSIPFIVRGDVSRHVTRGRLALILARGQSIRLVAPGHLPFELHADAYEERARLAPVEIRLEQAPMTRSAALQVRAQDGSVPAGLHTEWRDPERGRRWPADIDQERGVVTVGPASGPSLDLFVSAAGMTPARHTVSLKAGDADPRSLTLWPLGGTCRLTYAGPRGDGSWSIRRVRSEANEDHPFMCDDERHRWHDGVSGDLPPLDGGVPDRKTDLHWLAPGRYTVEGLWWRPRDMDSSIQAQAWTLPIEIPAKGLRTEVRIPDPTSDRGR